MASQEITAAFAKKGVEMLDAPVCDGEIKAFEETITVMVEGKQEGFNAK